MPKIDPTTVPVRIGTGYPEPFNAAFAKGSGNGHHLQNLGPTVAVYLDVGSRQADDLTTCSDIDLMSHPRDGRFVHRDGTPYP